MELTGNTITTVVIEGGSSNRLFGNALVATAAKPALGFAGTATTGLSVVGNSFTSVSAGTAIAIDRAITGRIEGNVLRTGTIGIAITAASVIEITGNDIGYSGTGVSYRASARLNGNIIHHNAVGIVSDVADPAAALGYGVGAFANTLSQNVVGLSLQGGAVTGQRIVGNTTGVTGSGVLGGLDAARANIIERNGVGVSAFAGTISFNRIGYSETIGIQASGGQRILHNVVYRNGQAGILVTGSTTDVRIGNNTVYASDAGADAIRLAGSASNVEIVGNILWSEAGTAIFVENTAQSGFFSDYNTLYAGETGALVFWTRSFVDILDWQADVARFDLHSVGRTVIDPGIARPAFADLARNDFRIIAPAAGQQATSPSALGGDPFGRFLGLLDGLNLLANPGFEAGLTGWTTNIGATVTTGNPAPYNGARAFSGGLSQAIGSAAQQINLLARGFTAAEIDTAALEVVFGARLWLQASANDQLDAAGIRLVFRDASGNTIGDPVTISQTIAETRWNLLWDRLRLPAGTRSIDWSFTTTRLGSANPVYLDDAMLAVVPRTLATAQGAYASEMQVHAATSTLRLRSPDLYIDWEVDRLKAIRWDSTGPLTGTPVRIELWQDGPDGPAFRSVIAAQTQDDGEFIWMPAQNGVAAGEKGLRIKVLRVGAPGVFDLTTETFSVPELGNTYYVDDGSNNGDVFTPGAVGSNRNTGKLATAPKPNPVNVLRTYDLVAGSTLFIDTGDYPMIYGITVSGQSDLGAGIGIEEGFSILGPSAEGAVARLYSANASVTLDALVDITNADFMTIGHLTLENAKRGLRAGGGSDDLTIGNITVEGFTAEGFSIDTQSATRSFSHLVARGTGNVGFNFAGSLGSLSDLVATARQQAVLVNGSIGSIENIEVYGAATGLEVYGSIASFRTVYAHDNTQFGAYLTLSGGSTIESSRFSNNGRYGLYVSASGAGVPISSPSAPTT